MAGDSASVYYLLKYPCDFGESATLDLDVKSGAVSVASSSTEIVTAKSFISANAGGFVDSALTIPPSLVGGISKIDAYYSFGNINKIGDSLQFNPVGDSLFNAACYQLVGVQVIDSDIPNLVPLTSDWNAPMVYSVENNSQKANGTNNKVQVRYFFRINCLTGSSQAAILIL